MAIFEKPKPAATAALPEPALQEQLAALLKTKQGLLDRAKPISARLDELRWIRNPAAYPGATNRSWVTTAEWLQHKNDPLPLPPSFVDDPEETLRRTLAGEPLADSRSLEERIHQTSSELNAIELALEHIDNETRTVKARLANAYAKSKRPEYDAIIARLAKHLPQVQSAAMELQALRSHLRDNGSLGGLFSIELPEFLMGRQGELAALCEQLKGF
jgi:hypothetical protein